MNLRSAAWRALGPLLLAGSAAAAPAPETVDDTLDWAEWAYPGSFANGSMSEPVTFQGRTYRARHYDGPWGTRWLGVDDDGQVWGLGDFTGGAPQALGTLASFSNRAAGTTCRIYPLDPACGNTLPERRLALRTQEVAIIVDPQRKVLAWTADHDPPYWLPDLGIQARSVIMPDRFITLALGTDGRVSGWGRFDVDIDGRAFNASVSRPPWVLPHDQPQPFHFPSRIIQVAWAGQGLVALRADGSLWLRPGRLVDAGGGLQRVSAVRALGLPPLRALARGQSRLQDVLAIARDDGVWQVSVAYHGSGPFDRRPSTYARRLEGLPPLRDVVCQHANCLALARDGSVWAWGSNHFGQLGQGVAAPLIRADPQRVPGLTRIVDVAIAGAAMLAVDSDGRVWSWGQGELGTGDDSVVATATVVPGIDQVDEIVGMGLSHTAVLARRRDGTVWTWGSFGDEFGVWRPTPVRLQWPGLEVLP